MTGVALTTREKQVAREMHLRNNVGQLNEFVKNTHKSLKHKEVLERRMIKEEKQVKAESINNFKREFESLTKRKSVADKDIENECNLKKLTRIMIFFTEPENINQRKNIKEITDFTLLLNKPINEGLKFLTRFGIIKEVKDGGRYSYVYEKKE